MTLKQIKLKDGQTVAVNVDQIVRVNPVGSDETEIVLSNDDVLLTTSTLVESIKWLSLCP